MKLVTYPYASTPTNAEAYYGNNESLGHGLYPVGTSRFWHGGVHITVPSSEPVRAIADGKIIAWRLNDTLPEYAPPGSEMKYPFSTGFVLIKHILDNNQLLSPSEANNTKQWPYYSLYMHLLHKPELAKKTQLPLFLIAQRQSISAKTYDPVVITQPVNSNAYKFCKIKHTASGQEGWIEGTAVSSNNRLNYPLEYLYTMDPARGLDAAIKLDQVVTSDIAVNAGEVIGYGGSLAFEGSLPDMLHFEIFTDEARLMEIFANPTTDVLGEVYLEAASQMYDKPQNKPQRTAQTFAAGHKFYSVSPVNADGEGQTPLQYFKFRLNKNSNSPEYYCSQLVKFYSLADWKKWGWQSMKESGKFSQDGFCDSTTPLFNLLDKNHDNTIDLLEIQAAKSVLRKIAVEHPTEWEKSSNETKYARLKAGESGLPTLTGDSYTQFIEHVEKQQFWEEVSGLPPANAVWHIHPIGFVDHLRQSQCTLNGVVEEEFKTQLEETLRLTIDLLEKRQRQMSRWDAQTQASFLKWFGVAANISSAEYITIRERIVKMLELVKTRQHKHIWRAGFNKSVAASYGSVFAYVWGSDVHHRIFIGGAFHTAKNTGIDSRVGVLIHEMSHFVDAGGTNAVAPYREEIYQQKWCIDLAKRDSVYALKNADSFEYFMEDGFNEI